MIEALRPPGLLTVATHGLVLLLLALLILLLWPFRAAVSVVAELLIRASDGALDAFRDRLTR